VARLLSALREIADLVLPHPPFFHPPDRFEIERRDRLVFRDRHDTEVDALLERRALFQVEHVDRDVPNPRIDHLIDRAHERLLGLGREPDDEVGAHAHPRGGRQLQRRERSVAPVPAAERNQLSVVRRLDAYAQAIDPQSLCEREEGRVDVFRIRLDRHLGLGRPLPPGRNRGEEPLDLGGRASRGGSSAQIDRIELDGGLDPKIDLLPQRLEVGLFMPQIRRNGERAVRAPDGAERQMDVKTGAH
jgi:hypothetical protein